MFKSLAALLFALFVAFSGANNAAVNEENALKTAEAEQQVENTDGHGHRKHHHRHHGHHHGHHHGRYNYYDNNDYYGRGRYYEDDYYYNDGHRRGRCHGGHCHHRHRRNYYY